MKSYRLSPNEFMLVLRDEDILASLKKFAVEKKVASGRFTGIGAVSSAKIAFYNFFTKEYQSKNLGEPMEIISLIGNFAMMGSEHVVHCHIGLGRENMSMTGGHVMEGCIARVCEIHVVKTVPKITRNRDGKTGLNLIK
ncbi:MAG: DUF296 domain-containing protein [Candidatus Aenigmarchaeota archaeon]|nr:DUF296 domain-containing protein [Candidatus Aenigmarchaeota archaeon]